ncbi:molybdopterin-dependent oxidoreductase [Pseudonocardia sp.]|uniref:molybdopterin-dependent oxidoreductase n=1 Tax=Pseudonocardia sp. TaxID=60912 RepID=UPI00260A3960|nr:molybdopterin-dependent oxidoreductase [Pseudonocardia sp.]MCW2718023.1 oxidoreductase molybdopterin binding protein [Pseudonocardia sp.]
MSTTAAPPQPTARSRAGLPVGWAGLIGLLAVLAALGVGHLVAALVAPASSPFLAVGDAVINYSPEPVTEFAKVTFGTADKPILLSGMAVVIAIVAVVAGIASRRSPRPGLTVVIVLGVLGFGAVSIARVFSPLDLIAPLASLAAGVLSFRGLHSLALRTYETSPRSRASGVSRRNVLIGGSVAVGVGALVSGGAGLLLGNGVGNSRRTVTSQLKAARLTERAPAIPAGAAFTDVGTPTFLTANPDFYRIDVALRIPSQTASAWSMKIHGMVGKEITLTFDDLLSRPLVERTITMTCVSNPIGGNLISTTNFIGVELRDILLEAGIQPGADQLFSTSVDGWYTGTPTDVVMEPGRGALLAIGMNGEALPPEHGFPVRMVVPGLYGYVSATKWVVDLEATTFSDPAKRGYWLERSWAQKAPIKTMSRIDSPQGFAKVPAGKVTVSGIAWAQHTGIEKVEVRMDGGPWREATLSTEVNVDTWRMWKADFTLAAGSHTVQSRATDRSGYTQTEMRADPIPDGASGWQAAIFTVS